VTRAFLAIRPMPEVLDAVEASIAPIAMPAARRTPRDQWHFTVQFLGNDADVDAVADAFARTPFDAGVGTLRLGGADAIGRRRRARILYLGLSQGADWMRQVADQAATRLEPLGHVRDEESKTFLAHVTLARFRELTDLRELCERIGSEPVGPSWQASEVILYESRLSSTGARHIERARFPTARRDGG
jgi:2'-5' RNA ligase